MKILILTYWKKGGRSDGGIKRSDQIVDIIKSAAAGGEFKEVCLDVSIRGRLKFPSCLSDIWFMILELRYGIKNALRVVSDMRILRAVRRDWGDPDLIIWESIASRAPIYLFEKKKIIAFPHNIESLTVQRYDLIGSRDVFEAMRTELTHFRGLRHVFTISREESFIMVNAGVGNSYLPYYPVDTVVARLMSIKKARAGKSRSGRFLILGSVINRVTEVATRKLLQFLAKADGDFRGRFEFLLCGNGTDMFKSEVLPECVSLLGQVSDERLNDIMTEVDAALVYQEEGAGALTRIVELLVSGIPVIASFHAARSAAPISGLHVFDGVDELVSLLNAREWPDFNCVDEHLIFNYKSARRRLVELIRKL